MIDLYHVDKSSLVPILRKVMSLRYLFSGLTPPYTTKYLSAIIEIAKLRLLFGTDYVTSSDHPRFC